MDFLRGMLDFAVSAAQAHEKWFVPVTPVTSVRPVLYETVNVLTVGALFAVLAVTVIGYLVTVRFERSALAKRWEENMHVWRDYAAGILAVTTGLTLVFMAMRGHLVASNYDFPPGLPGLVLKIVELSVGILLMVGLFTPVAAIGVLVLYASTFLFNPIIEPVDYVNLVGIGLFLLTFARGRYSFDWFLGKPILSSARQRKAAYLLLRTLTGFTFLWLALLKWRRPDLHLGLMDKYPNLNPYVMLEWVGLKMSREVYIFLLAIIEATVGIFEMFGFLTRFTCVLLMVLFMGSIGFLGPSELVGHLPIVGTLFVLFIYGDDYHRNRKPDRYALHESVGAFAAKKDAVKT